MRFLVCFVFWKLMVFVEIKQTRNVFNLMDCGLNEYAIQLKKKAGIV